jgi:hypothetical protein
MLKHSRRRLALAAVALVAMAQGAAGAATNPVGLTQPVQATKADQDPLRTYSGPFMAVDPSNSDHVVASFVDMRTRRCGLMRSTDAGQTWRRLDASPANNSYPSCLSNNSNIFQGPLAFGRNGTLYYGLAGWDIQDRAVGSGGNVSILLSRSTDLGDTWQTTVVHNARGLEGEKVENNRPVGNIAVDSKSGNDDIVYVTWQYSTPFVLAPNANPTRAVVSTSTNGGRDFGDAVEITQNAAWQNPANRQAAITSPTATTLAPGATTTTIAKPEGSRAAQPDQAANFGGRNPAVTVDNKGNVYALWFNTSANVAPGALTGQFVSKSTDHGKTWTATQVAPMNPQSGGVGRITWTSQGGPEGTVHVVSQANNTVTPDNPGGVANESDVVYKQSTDGGKTWSAPKIVNDDNPKDLFGQYIPMISAAPNGRLDVAWWDTRSDPGTRSNDVYYSSSSDNGKTWSKNVRVTDRSIDRKLGVWGNNFDMSSPPGVASTNSYAIFGWDDTRNSDVTSPASAGFGGGLQDIYTAAYQYKVLGGGTSTALKAVLAGVVGLLVVGLVLLGVSVSRKRQFPSPEPGQKTKKVGAKPGAKETVG